MDGWEGFALQNTSVLLTAGVWKQILPANSRRQYWVASSGSATNPNYQAVNIDPLPTLQFNKVTPYQIFEIGGPPQSNSAICERYKYGAGCEEPVFARSPVTQTIIIGEVVRDRPVNKSFPPEFQCSLSSWRAYRVRYLGMSPPIKILQADPSRLSVFWVTGFTVFATQWGFGGINGTIGQIQNATSNKFNLPYSEVGNMMQDSLFLYSSIDFSPYAFECFAM